MVLTCAVPSLTVLRQTDGQIEFIYHVRYRNETENMFRYVVTTNGGCNYDGASSTAINNCCEIHGQ